MRCVFGFVSYFVVGFGDSLAVYCCVLVVWHCWTIRFVLDSVVALVYWCCVGDLQRAFDFGLVLFWLR